MSEKPLLLTIDIGNTRSGVALFKEREIVFRKKQSTPGSMNDEWLNSIIPSRFHSGLGRAVAASVVPVLNRPLRKAVESIFDIPLHLISHRSDTGIVLDVDSPSQVGADRIAVIAGARTLYPAPLIVVDSGTATTFDLLDSRGAYIGGAILPGIDISLKSLSENTAKLGLVKFRIPGSPVGRNTADHIRAGAYYGFIGSVRNLILEYKGILGNSARVIATGGFMKYLNERIKEVDEYEPDLVHIGLAAISRRFR